MIKLRFGSLHNRTYCEKVTGVWPHSFCDSTVLTGKLITVKQNRIHGLHIIQEAEYDATKLGFCLWNGF